MNDFPRYAQYLTQQFTAELTDDLDLTTGQDAQAHGGRLLTNDLRAFNLDK
jgi:hypothetical protein